MLNRIAVTPSWFRANWFVIAAAVVFATDLAAIHAKNWATPRMLEAGVLSDLAVVIPGLYVACYWRHGKRTYLRAVALASLGFWATSKLLPEAGHFLIRSLWPVRYFALAVLLAIELKVALAIYRAVFAGASREEAAASLQAEAGMPAWAARLAAAEASFWRSAFIKAKAFFSRRRG